MDVDIRRCEDKEMCISRDVEMCRYGDVMMCRCGDVEMCRYRDLEMYQCGYVDRPGRRDKVMPVTSYNTSSTQQPLLTHWNSTTIFF